MLRIPGRACAAVSLFALSFLLPFAAHAVQRTFVSISGSDANTASNCSATAPCRGFAAALTVTDSGGEIIVQHSGGYGPVTINKSVSIIAPEGVYAGISVFSDSGITIATAGVKVVLRGLTINALSASRGIDMTAGDELTVENCHISNFSGTGLFAETAAKIRVLRSVFLSNNYGAYFSFGANVLVEDTQFSGGTYGVYVYATGAGTSTRVEVNRSIASFVSDYGFSATAVTSGSVAMSISRSSAIGSITGYMTHAAGSGIAQMEVKDSVASQNTYGGSAYASGGTVRASFSNNLFSRNGDGLRAEGSGVTLTATGNTVTNNSTGLAQTNGAIFESAGDNIVRQNTTQFSGTITGVTKM